MDGAWKNGSKRALSSWVNSINSIVMLACSLTSTQPYRFRNVTIHLSVNGRCATTRGAVLRLPTSRQTASGPNITRAVIQCAHLSAGSCTREVAYRRCLSSHSPLSRAVSRSADRRPLLQRTKWCAGARYVAACSVDSYQGRRTPFWAAFCLLALSLRLPCACQPSAGRACDPRVRRG